VRALNDFLYEFQGSPLVLDLYESDSSGLG
jgi:hypothetical protein